MKSELLNHKLSYSALFAFLSISLFLYLAAWPDIVYLRYLSLLISVFYFFWGVLVHLKRKTFSKKIILEYFGVSFLVGLMLFLITV